MVIIIRSINCISLPNDGIVVISMMINVFTISWMVPGHASQWSGGSCHTPTIYQQHAHSQLADMVSCAIYYIRTMLKQQHSVQAIHYQELSSNHSWEYVGLILGQC